MPRSEIAKKLEKEGSGRTAGGMDQQDSARRAWRWNLGAGKWVTRPQAPTGETQSAGKDRIVGECLSARLPPASRSASCASESEVSSRRRACRKSWPKKLAEKVTNGEEIRRRNHRRRGDQTAMTLSEGFRKENKVTEMKHSHRKKIRFSPL